MSNPLNRASGAWQEYLAGRLRTPRAIRSAFLAEALGPSDTYDRFFDLPDDTGLIEALARLRAPVHFHSDSYLRQQERADWAQVDPRLMFWSAHLCEALRRRHIPLYVHTALRDRAEQDRVVSAGHSKARYPSSAHNIGEAVDIVHGVHHWDLTLAEWAALEVLGRLSLDKVNAYLPAKRKLRLAWGGTFKGLYDPAHWEIEDFRSRRRPLPALAPVYRSPRMILKGVREGLISLA